MLVCGLGVNSLWIFVCSDKRLYCSYYLLHKFPHLQLNFILQSIILYLRSSFIFISEDENKI